MTVCIASIADNGGAIVVAADQMASMPIVTADHTLVKADFIGHRWYAMWAADDIAPIPPIVRRSVADLKQQDRTQDWTGPQVAQALSKAYQDETRTRAEAEYLSPFGLDMPAFLSNGAHIFQENYQTRLRDIEQYDLGVTFLVAGHWGVTSSLFVVERRGHIRYLDKPGFWAIGSGDMLALSAMALRRHNTTRSIAETIYTVLEAKFAAELAAGVGRHTTVGVLAFNNLISIIKSDVVDAIREIWVRQSSAPAPADALATIGQWWDPIAQKLDNAHLDEMKRTLTQTLGPPAQAATPAPPKTKRDRKVRPPSRG
jgi:hypothetical protein